MKRIATLLILTFALAMTAHAQIFLEDDESSTRLNSNDPNVYVDLPGGFGTGVDWYTPTGSGIALLTALGGAYLLKKARKTKRSNDVRKAV